MSAARERVRSFLALEIDPALREALVALVARLQAEVPGVRWARPDALHLTLRFLGDADPDDLPPLVARLESEAGRSLPGMGETIGLGMFPPKGPPRVVWVGFVLPEPLLALQRLCERAAVDAGFAPERRPFRPHLTVGRFRGRGRRPTLSTASLPAARFEALTLFRSELRPDGAVYTPLYRLPPAS